MNCSNWMAFYLRVPGNSAGLVYSIFAVAVKTANTDVWQSAGSSGTVIFSSSISTNSCCNVVSSAGSYSASEQTQE